MASGEILNFVVSNLLNGADEESGNKSCNINCFVKMFIDGRDFIYSVKFENLPSISNSCTKGLTSPTRMPLKSKMPVVITADDLNFLGN